MQNTNAARESIKTRAEKFSIKLSSISSIKPGDQWSTNHEAPLKPGISTSLTRTCWDRNESRGLNIADIKECINGSFRLLRDIEAVKESGPVESTDLIVFSEIVSDIKSGLLNSIEGISSLKVTYHNDEPMLKQMDGLIKSIRDRYKTLDVVLVDKPDSPKLDKSD
jgi:hypothetical protein